MKNIPKVKTIFIIPFYDKDIPELHDTIESINYYTKERHKIICINDCQKNENKTNLEQKINSAPIINFLPRYDPNWPRNAYGPLFCKLFQAMEYAVKQFRFDFLVKLDTDALIVGSKLFEQIARYFEDHSPDIGQIGSYRIRADGKKRTRWRWFLYLLFTVYFKSQLSRNSLIWSECLAKAKKNGYRLGESMLGGAYIYKYECIRKIIALYPYLDIEKDKLYLTKIGEDVIFSLLTFASGYKIGDFAGPNDPMAIAHKSLPIDKEEIVKQKKQIIHSIREGTNGESEESLRAFFKNYRQ